MVRVRLWTGGEVSVGVRDGASVRDLEGLVKKKVLLAKESVLRLRQGKRRLNPDRLLEYYDIGSGDCVCADIESFVVVFEWSGVELKARLPGEATGADAREYFRTEHSARKVRIWWGEEHVIDDDDVIRDIVFSTRRNVFRESNLHVRLSIGTVHRKVLCIGKKSFQFDCDARKTLQDVAEEIAEEYGILYKHVLVDADADIYCDLEQATRVLAIPKSVPLYLYVNFKVDSLKGPITTWFRGDSTVSDAVDEVIGDVDHEEWRCTRLTDPSGETLEMERPLLDLAVRGCFALGSTWERCIHSCVDESIHTEWQPATETVSSVVDGTEYSVFVGGKPVEGSTLLSEIESNVLELQYKTIVLVNANGNARYPVRLADLKEKSTAGLRQCLADMIGASVERVEIQAEFEDLAGKPDGYEVPYQVKQARFLFRFESGETFALPLQATLTRETLLGALGKQVNLPPRELVLKFEFPIHPGRVYDFVSAKREVELNLVLADGTKKRFKLDEAPATVAHATEFLHRKLGTTDSDCTYAFACDGITLASGDMIPKNEVKVNQTFVRHIYTFVGSSRRFQSCFLAKATVSDAMVTVGRELGYPSDRVCVNSGQAVPDTELLADVFTRSVPVRADICSPISLAMDGRQDTLWLADGSTGLDVKREIYAINHYPADQIVLHDASGHQIESKDVIPSGQSSVTTITATREYPVVPVRVRNLDDRREVTVDAVADETASAILRKACVSLGMSADNASLIFAGKFLDDFVTIAELYLTGGSVLLLYTEK